MGFKSIMKTILPTLVPALGLGGPLGQLAANAIGKAIGVEGLTPDKAESAIEAAQAKDPDILLKLKQVDADFQLKMAELGFESAQKLEEVAAGDRASARLREMTVKDKIPAILAVGVTVGFFSLLGLFAFREIPVASQTILNVLVGSLGTAWIGIINYYFGSSSGSASKTALLAQQGNKGG